MAYRVKWEFSHNPQLTTVVDGTPVGLNGQFEKTIPATVNYPSRKVTVRKATQADLKVLFEQGNPCIEEYEPSKMEPEPEKAKS